MGNVRKWSPLVLIAIAIVASVAAFRSLPPQVELQLGGVVPFAVPAELVPRALVFLMPVLALVLWLAFRAVTTPFGERVGKLFAGTVPDVTSAEQFARFEKTYDLIVLSVVCLLLGVQASVIAAAFSSTQLAARAIPITLGVFMLVVGNVAPRLRPNWVAGVRTSRTLGNPQIWRTTHRWFGGVLVAGGLLTVLVGLLLPEFGLVTGIAMLLVACFAGFVASMRGPVELPPSQVLL
jgi:hypothetical protein